MAFFLRFRSQLRRTRPELIPFLENTAAAAIKEAGGEISREQNTIHAVINENSPGIWIDILILVETIIRAAEENTADLYGFSFLLWKDQHETIEPLSRFLAGTQTGGGIFMDRPAVESFKYYATFEDNGEQAAVGTKYGAESFYKLKEIKIFVPTGSAGFSLREKFALPPDKGLQHPAVLVIGQSLKGRRDELYRSITANGNSIADSAFPPLFIRFGNNGLNALADSWTEQLHALTFTDYSENGRNIIEEITAARKFLFRQRLRNTPSPFAIRTACRFFNLILTAYSDLAGRAGKTPAIILENIHIAEKEAAEIVIDALQGKQEFSLLGLSFTQTDAGDPAVTPTVISPKWKKLFSKVFKTSGDSIRFSMQDLSPDLWEMGYACMLLGRYFPPDLFHLLFEEMGKSPAMISRSFSLLFALKVTDTPSDSRPWNEDFYDRAEAALGERKDAIKTLVLKRLLAWVERKKIDTCFRLLTALTELGDSKNIDDSTIVQSIQGELVYGYGQDINENIFTATGDTDRAPIIRYILNTLRALHSGNIENIHTAFACPPPDCTAFPKLKTQLLINQSLYHLGMRDNESGFKTIKEATLLCQSSGGPSLACSYRLFALESLSRRQIGEAVNYLDFALENAVKFGVPQDIGMAAYYSASVHLLHGNLSLSQKLAEKARLHFLEAGNPEWADKSRFLEGRLAFETGAYQQAAEIFNDIRNNPTGEIYTEKDNTLAAWIHRAGVFCGEKTVPVIRGNGYDADLFYLEAQYHTGNFQTADELSTGQTNNSGIEEFYFTECPDWRSGFAQNELLYFSWSEFRDRMLGAFRSLVLSKTSLENNGKATDIIQHILRTSQFPEIDPSDIFLHFVWYKVLQQTDASRVDISTAISIAFNRLQGRAARIDDPETRHQFLTRPYWNTTLTQAAKEFKLI